MQDSNFNVGDKVRYRLDGSTRQMRGIEGVITAIHNTSAAVDITKLNSTKAWVVGQEIYPDLDNLELVDDEAAELAQLADLAEVISAEAVVHPAHYGGDTTYEVIKVAEAWGLDKDAYLFNVIKYVGRAGKKSKATLLEDLKKARFYLDRRIKALEEASTTS